MEKMNIYQKLCKIQNELKVPKSQRNNFGNYNYRNCEDILEAVKPLLKENELILTITDEIIAIHNNFPIQVLLNGKDKYDSNIYDTFDGSRFYIKSTAILTDGEKEIKVSAFAREEENKKGMDSCQLTGSTSSYARKYALNGLFCIDDTKDSDTTNNNEKPQITQQNNTIKSTTTEQNKSTKPVSKEKRGEGEPCPDCDNTLKIFYWDDPKTKSKKPYWKCIKCGARGWTVKSKEEVEIDKEIPF